MNLYDFDKKKPTNNWQILDDGVMGGLSKGKLETNKDGHGVFSGNISLENYGGFSSLRYQFEPKVASNSSKIKIRLKGDGKKYQFRVKDKIEQYHSYIFFFETSGEWETITIPLKMMYPSFRGRKLRIPNFNHTELEEIAFLFGNKKTENFKLIIDSIDME